MSINIKQHQKLEKRNIIKAQKVMKVDLDFIAFIEFSLAIASK